MASLDPKTSKRVFVLSFAYYFFTTAVAIALGIVLVVAIGPGYRTKLEQGSGSNDFMNTAADIKVTTRDTVFDMISPIRFYGAELMFLIHSAQISSEHWAHCEAVELGIVLVVAIGPGYRTKLEQGSGSNDFMNTAADIKVTTRDTVFDMIRLATVYPQITFGNSLG
ncbi:unnamed protein product [Toxocara canis]|uniref:Uncharacterized protein n=1 Tax=Toxocara canis TaxID=6265 RepID=A0A3P7H655_TOXCA|nr:unnamed protein product [Toxocara canis]